MPLNWGLVALAHFDLVAALLGMSFGQTSVLSSLVYFRASSTEGAAMIKAIEIRGRLAGSILQPMPLGRRFASYEPVQRLVSCIETTSYALVRRRILSIIALCSIVWLTSVWLAAAIAQAQDLPANNSNLNTSEPAIRQRSIEKAEAPHLLLSMVDHTDLEVTGSFRRSPVQSTNPHPTGTPCQNMKNVSAGNDAVRFDCTLSSKLYASLTKDPIPSVGGPGATPNVGNVGLPSNPRGAEFSSLAALASTPSPSLLYPLQTKYALQGSGQTATSSLTNDNRALVYQFGTINFVVNHLPNSFSVSSPGHSLSDARW